MHTDQPIRVTRTQLSVFGRTLRRHALYSLTRRSPYGRQVAADLLEVADTIDPDPEEPMSPHARSVNAVIDLLSQAQDALAASEKRAAALAEELAAAKAAVPVEDPEDAAVWARLDAVVAPQAAAEPSAAGPASQAAAPAAPSQTPGVTFDVPLTK